MTARDLIEAQVLDEGEVDLDEFGIEKVELVDVPCEACESKMVRVHSGWGSVCWECGESRDL